MSVVLCCALQLLYYEADSDLANTMRPSWDEHSYRHVDVVAADRVFADINDAVVNAETRSVAVTHRGVYFTFYDQVRHCTPAPCVPDYTTCALACESLVLLQFLFCSEFCFSLFLYPCLSFSRDDYRSDLVRSLLISTIVALVSIPTFFCVRGSLAGVALIFINEVVLCQPGLLSN